MRKKRLYLGSAHLAGVAFIVKKDVAANPMDVLLLNAISIMTKAERVYH